MANVLFIGSLPHMCAVEDGRDLVVVASQSEKSAILVPGDDDGVPAVLPQIGMHDLGDELPYVGVTSGDEPVLVAAASGIAGMGNAPVICREPAEPEASTPARPGAECIRSASWPSCSGIPGRWRG